MGRGPSTRGEIRVAFDPMRGECLRCGALVWSHNYEVLRVWVEIHGNECSVYAGEGTEESA